VPQKTPLAQSMLDDMYRIHALLKGNDTSDLSNADSIKSGTTRCVGKTPTTPRRWWIRKPAPARPIRGSPVFRRGTFRATWMNTVDRKTVTQTISSNGGGHSFGVPPAGIGAERVIWVRP
jgi:hypothetical protein